MVTQNQEQTRDAWNTIASGYDAFVTPTHMSLSNEALDRVGLQPGMRFLDVAAGSGALSIPAARRGAQVLSVDLSPVMIERLHERARREGLSNLETRVMDGHALDLEANTFDVAGSQFGVMLFPDMPLGIREMARVTKPGGRVLMNVYGSPQDVEFFSFFVRAIATVVPGFVAPPSDPPPLPFQLQDPERLRQELDRAGLIDIRIETVSETLQFQSATQMWDWLVNSNPVAEMVLTGVTEEQRAATRDVLEGMLRARAGGSGPATLTNPVHIGIGTKPDVH